jgi:hypothetical protein
MLLELLKRALEWEDPYEDMPHFDLICEELQLNPYDDRDTLRASIEEHLNMMDLEGDLAGTDFDGGDHDVE